MSELLDRLMNLRQYQQDGKRHPHKPLLVLLALGQLAETGSSKVPWALAEVRLAELIAEFGPSSRTSVAQSAAYPFTRLQRDQVWRVTPDSAPDDSSPKDLRERAAVGQLVPALEQELSRDPALLHATARRIVDQQFPSTLADDVLLACGLDPEAAAAQTVTVGGERKRRSAAWRDAILMAWNRSCAFCGFDGALGGAAVGIEAAHVRWFNFDGPDELDNGLALCSLHHKLFDRGALGLAANRVLVSTQFTANTEAGRRTYELHDVELRPRPGTRLPASSHIEWHTSQVFKGMALSA